MLLPPFSPVSVVAAALPSDPELMDLVAYQLNGLIVVLVALGSLWGFLELSGAYFRRRAPQAAPRPTTPAASPPAAPTTSGTPPETMAIIAAAVYVTFGPNAKVASVVSLEPPSATWGQEGRRHLHATRRAR